MKKTVFIICCLIILWGCARVRVEAPKEPIKIDIAMRLDIYQHVEKDINTIEDIVSGPQNKTKASDNHSLLNYFIKGAYAQDLSPEVEQAALRRKDRHPELAQWQEKGIIGENKSGLVEIRSPQASNSATIMISIVNQENLDRMIIYQAIAAKNGTSVEDVQKIYTKRLQTDAPAGTPIEILNNVTSKYEWIIK